MLGLSLWAEAEVLRTEDVISNMQIVMNEDFNEESLNTSLWTIRGNQGSSTWNRFIYNDPRVTSVQDGALVCRAIKTPDDITNYTKDMITGAVTSAGKFAFTYGYVEARIKTKRHRGNFPAFWLMPEKKQNNWYGEIDVWEAFNLNNKAYHTIHSEYTLYVNTNTVHSGSEDCDYDNDQWHILGVLREPEKITFFLDGVSVYQYHKSTDGNILEQGQWPFDVKYHIILNQSVSGGSGTADNAPDLDFTYETQFDYVRVYQSLSDAIADGHAECPMNDWDSTTGYCNICGESCEHTEKNANNICTTCGYDCNTTWDDGTGVNIITGEEHSHTWAANGQCTVCKYRCTHDFSNGTRCAECGQEQTVFMKIIENIFDRTMEDYINTGASTIDNYLNLLNDEGAFTDVDYDDTKISGWNPNTHNDRLLRMVCAYAKPDPNFKYRGNDVLYDAIKRAFVYWYTKKPTSQNWYHNQIGWPQYVGLAMCMMRKAPKHLTAEIERDMLSFYVASGADPAAWTGANKQDIALQWIYRALLEENIDNLDYAVAQYYQPLAYTVNEGIQHDYSFQQHSNQYYPEGYGKSLLTVFFKAAYYLKDTKYHTSEAMAPVSNFLRHCFIPMNRGSYTLYNGVGRGIAQPDDLNLRGYRGNISRMAQLEPEHAEFYNNAYTRLDTYTQNSSLGLEPLHYHYYRSDYALHQRPGYTMDFRTYSTRTCRAERGNGQGLLNYFLADGGSEIVVDGDEYLNIFPVWDWARIPGTTTPHLTDIPNHGDWGRYGTSTFTGGITDGKYGFATYHLNDTQTDVLTSGYKSIFFFDNEIVCLGTNIKSDNEAEINTTLNQCLLKTDVTVETSDGNSATLTERGDHQYTNLSWINQGKVTYHFPADAEVTVSNKTQTGNWKLINSNKDQAASQDVFTTYINHGAKPTDGSYAYYVLPNTAGIADAKTVMDNIEITNNHDHQAVYNKTLGILQIVFHTATPFETDGMRIYPKSPCTMMLTQLATANVKAYLSDPSYSLSSIVVTMTINGESGSKYNKIWSPSLATTPDLCGKTYDCLVSEMADCEGDECTHTHYTNGFCDICHTPEAAPLSSDGTTYEICNAGQLAWIAEQVNILPAGETLKTNVTLMKDIDFGTQRYNWPGIGHWTSSTDYNGFSGVFDGQGYEIRNFYMEPKVNYAGLFNCICGAIIKNFTIRGEVNVTTTRQYVGSVVGISNYNSSISTGLNSRSVIQDIHSLVNINLAEASMSKFVGGIVGQLYKYNDNVNRCRYSGTINATDSYNSIAGIVGNAASSSITNCLFDGRIICTSTETSGSGVVVAGILGSVSGGRNIYVTNNLSHGTFDLASNSNGNSGVVCGYMNIKNGETIYPFDLGGTHYTTSGVHLSEGTMNAVGFRTAYTNLLHDATDVSESSALYDGTTLRSLGIANWSQDEFTEGHYPTPSAVGFVCQHTYGITADYLCTICGALLPTDDGSYIISNSRTLKAFRDLVNNGETALKALLASDITLTGDFGDPIGKTRALAFTGEFDGQGHAISGFQMSSSSNSNLGLFGFVGNTTSAPVIRDFTISGTIEYTSTGVMNSGVVSTMQSGTLQGIHSELTINRTVDDAKDTHLGGVLGFVDGSYKPDQSHPILVDRCWFSGTINSRNAYGSTAGIVGQANQYVTISNCLMTGELSNTFSSTSNCHVAGILGYCPNTTAFGGIQHCLYAGSIVKEHRASNIYIASISGRDQGDKAKYNGNYAYFADGVTIPTTAISPVQTDTPLTTEQISDGSAVSMLGDAWGQLVRMDATPLPVTERVLDKVVYDDDADYLPYLPVGIASLKAKQIVYKRRSQYVKNVMSVCMPFALASEMLPEGATIYEYKNIHDETVTFSPIAGNSVSAGVPCFMQVGQDISGDWDINISNPDGIDIALSPVNPEGGIGLFGAFDTDTDINSDGTYKLNSSGTMLLRTTANSYCFPYRAYLKTGLATNAKLNVIYGDDDFETTTIHDFSSVNEDHKEQKHVYTLDGKEIRPTLSMPRGIYIIDGRKVVKY